MNHWAGKATWTVGFCNVGDVRGTLGKNLLHSIQRVYTECIPYPLPEALNRSNKITWYGLILLNFRECAAIADLTRWTAAATAGGLLMSSIIAPDIDTLRPDRTYRAATSSDIALDHLDRCPEWCPEWCLEWCSVNRSVNRSVNCVYQRRCSLFCNDLDAFDLLVSSTGFFYLLLRHLSQHLLGHLRLPARSQPDIRIRMFTKHRECLTFHLYRCESQAVTSRRPTIRRLLQEQCEHESWEFPNKNSY